MNYVKKKTVFSDIILIGTSLLGSIIAFNFFVQATLISSNDIKKLINSAIASLDIKAKSFNLIIISISTITFLISIIFYYLINKFVLIYILKNKIHKAKLFGGILIANIPGLLIGAILINSIGLSMESSIISKVLVFCQPIILSIILKDSFNSNKQFIKYISFLIAFSLINILVRSIII